MDWSPETSTASYLHAAAAGSLGSLAALCLKAAAAAVCAMQGSKAEQQRQSNPTQCTQPPCPRSDGCIGLCKPCVDVFFQVHMPSQYAASQPQHTLSSGDGGGLVYTSSAEQPLAPTKSMLDEAAAPQPVGGTLPTAGAAAAAGTPAGPAGSLSAPHS